MLLLVDAHPDMTGRARGRGAQLMFTCRHAHVRAGKRALPERARETRFLRKLQDGRVPLSVHNNGQT
jgi:hypothetical protein